MRHDTSDGSILETFLIRRLCDYLFGDAFSIVLPLLSVTLLQQTVFVSQPSIFEALH